MNVTEYASSLVFGLCASNIHISDYSIHMCEMNLHLCLVYFKILKVSIYLHWICIMLTIAYWYMLNESAYVFDIFQYSQTVKLRVWHLFILLPVKLCRYQTSLRGIASCVLLVLSLEICKFPGPKPILSNSFFKKNNKKKVFICKKMANCNCVVCHS